MKLTNKKDYEMILNKEKEYSHTWNIENLKGAIGAATDIGGIMEFSDYIIGEYDLLNYDSEDSKDWELDDLESESIVILYKELQNYYKEVLNLKLNA